MLRSRLPRACGSADRSTAHYYGSHILPGSKPAAGISPTAGLSRGVLSVEALPLRRDLAGVETRQVQATVEAGVLNFDTPVHDDGQSKVFGHLGCFIRPDA